MRLSTPEGRVAVVTGKGWHARAGAVAVSNYRPPSGAPWLDEATIGFETRTDLGANCGHAPERCMIPDCRHGTVLPPLLFTGWAVRWPRFSFGVTGRGGVLLSMARWRYRGWRRRRAAGATVLPQTADGWANPNSHPLEDFNATVRSMRAPRPLP